VFVTADTTISPSPDFDEEQEDKADKEPPRPRLYAGPEEITRPGDLLTDPPPPSCALRGYERDEEATTYFDRRRLGRGTPDWAQPEPDYVEEIDRLEEAALRAAAAISRQAEVRAQAEAMDHAEAVAEAAIIAAEAAFCDLSFDSHLPTTPPHQSRSRELPPLVFGEVQDHDDRFTSLPTVNRDSGIDALFDLPDDPDHLAEGTPQPEVLPRANFGGGVPETILTIPPPEGARQVDSDEPPSSRIFSWLKSKVRRK
jgi:hypothetical protein